MRNHKGLLTIVTLLAIVMSSLYLIYSSIQNEASPRHERLGSLLEIGEGVNVVELDGPGRLHVIDFFQNTSEWSMAESFLFDKGFEMDGSFLFAYQANFGEYIISILRAKTEVSSNMSVGEILLATEDSGNISAWIMVTNLPPDTLSGMDPEANSIPVMTYANGMPVFYVSFYHLIQDTWVPYHYWWHNSHDHPNWYYSHYDYWWWYYEWYGIEWVPWYDWFFGWYYHQRFFYWSTWFPIGEPSLVIAIFLPILLVLGRLVRIRQDVR